MREQIDRTKRCTGSEQNAAPPGDLVVMSRDKMSDCDTTDLEQRALDLFQGIHMTGLMKLSISFLLFAAFALSTEHAFAATTASIPSLGKGSLPARLYSNGAVCLVDEKRPSLCAKRLMHIPKRLMKAHSFTFYGVFDLDGDGTPEIFVDYWFPSSRREGDNVVVLVYKKIRGKYKQYLRLKAQSYGYYPGAWFLNEGPYSKAVFMTRYGGSSGSGLFYLNLKKKSLDLISGSVFLEGHPEFVDIDGDGIAEVYLPGRGRDRTSQPGAAVLHWKDQNYEMWWPDWNGTPTVIYAVLADVDGDGNKEIAAVLEPEQTDFDKYIDGKTPSSRELGVWKAKPEGIALLSRTKLPDARYLSEPTFGRVPPFSSKVELEYVRSVGCGFIGHEMRCHEED